MTADKPDLSKVDIQPELNEEPIERNEEGVPLIGGVPINERLRTDPEFFALAQKILRETLEEALGIDPNATPNKVTYTRTRDVDWENLKTHGPEDLLAPNTTIKTDKDPEQK